MAAGFLLFWHGTANFFDFPIANPHSPPEWVLISAGLISLVGGGLIFIGRYVHYAAFVCSGFLAVAYWIAYGYKDFFPYVNGGELAVLYSFVFLYISAKGAGIWSLDGTDK
ncbi:MAG: DoxX family protein [Pseudomonadales bacterium]